MNSAERRARTIFHAGNRVVALAVSACLLALLGFGMGGVPALGPALVPGHGEWRSDADRTMQRVPVKPVSQPQPYDPGLHRKLPVVPVAGVRATAALRPAAGWSATARAAAAASSEAISWELRP